jgi:hypothetical protein
MQNQIEMSGAFVPFIRINCVYYERHILRKKNILRDNHEKQHLAKSGRKSCFLFTISLVQFLKWRQRKSMASWIMKLFFCSSKEILVHYTANDRCLLLPSSFISRNFSCSYKLRKSRNVMFIFEKRTLLFWDSHSVQFHSGALYLRLARTRSWHFI